jgi:hypothetical protein
MMLQLVGIWSNSAHAETDQSAACQRSRHAMSVSELPALITANRMNQPRRSTSPPTKVRKSSELPDHPATSAHRSCLVTHRPGAVVRIARGP